MKWRRSKKYSKRLDVFRASNRSKDKNTPQTFRNKKSWIKKYTRPHVYKVPTVYKERRWREPEPLIDVLEEKDEVIVVAELAGFKKENLRTHVKNQRLTMSAEALDRKYYKSLNLPKRVIPNTLRTTYKNGVLEIRLKKGC